MPRNERGSKRTHALKKHAGRVKRGRSPSTLRAHKGKGKPIPIRKKRRPPKHYKGIPLRWLEYRLRKKGLEQLFRADCGRAFYFWRTTGAVPPLRCWLKVRPEVRSEIIWQSASGDLLFDNWSETQKEQLYVAFDLTRQGGAVVTDDPPPNMQLLEDSDYPATVLGEAHAWDLYLSILANTLYIEMYRLVEWSILDDPPEIRARLLTSRNLFTYLASYGGYALWVDHGDTVPAPADRTVAFLRNNSLIGPTRRDTIARVVEWCRQHLRHFSGPTTAANYESIWSYRGVPPTSGFFSGSGRYSTAGCRGTNGLLQDLLRAVNIPVDYVVTGITSGHATPYFVSEGLYLSHGDDPYNQWALGNPVPYPADALLIDETTYDAWLVHPPVISDIQTNIGRQVHELALVNLPLGLLLYYCIDQQLGKSHATGQVAQTFSRWYSVADLEGIDLWGRMDAKLTALGGCTSLPALP